MNAKTYKTMTEATEGLKKRGFTANFEYLNNAFRAVDTGKTFTPEELTIVEHHRFEGASDPDDLSIVYGIESEDGTRGILVDAYGAYANPDISAFLKKVRIERTYDSQEGSNRCSQTWEPVGAEVLCRLLSIWSPSAPQRLL